MGRIRSLICITTDGFADGKYAIIDAEFYEFSKGLLLDTESVVFGRNTFELFQDRWPGVLENEDEPAWRREMARILHEKHKTVYSSSLKSTLWNNSTILRKIDVALINAYKEEGKGGCLTLGSLGLVACLSEMDLIDDYFFCIQPLIAGDGVRLSDMLKPGTSRPLKYVGCQSLPSGVHIIHYVRGH